MKAGLRPTLVGGALAVLSFARASGAQPFDEPFATLRLSERLAHHRVPGVSIAVIDEGRIDWAEGFGFASLETGAPVSADTLFQAASISKPVAAVAALKLVEDGRVTLDEDLTGGHDELGQRAASHRGVLRAVAATYQWPGP